MKLPDRKMLYRRAIDKWGLPLQFGMLMEECAELIQATNKVMRKGTEDEKAISNLAEEMADVEIMIEQLKKSVDWMFLEEQVNIAKEKKLERLRSLLEEEN